MMTKDVDLSKYFFFGIVLPQEHNICYQNVTLKRRCKRFGNQLPKEECTLVCKIKHEYNKYLHI